MAEKEELARKCLAEYEGAKKLKEIQSELDQFEPLLGWALLAERERELEEHGRVAQEVPDVDRTHLPWPLLTLVLTNPGPYAITAW